MFIFGIYILGKLVTTVEAPTARAAALWWFDQNPKKDPKRDWVAVGRPGSSRFLFARPIADRKWRPFTAEEEAQLELVRAELEAREQARRMRKMSESEGLPTTRSQA
jgi:hypothetical protein